MSVLTDAKATLNTIAEKFKAWTGRIAGQGAYLKTTDALARVNGAEQATKDASSTMATAEREARQNAHSLQAVIANTQTADKHNAVSLANAAAEKAKKAKEALVGLDSKYKDVREAITAAQTAVNDAKNAQAAAASAIQKTSRSF